MTAPEPVSRRGAPPGGQPLFVYGTLMFPGVLERLLGRVPRSEPATAAGWRAAALADRPYPGLVRSPGSVDGRLLLDLTPWEWQIVDEFEADLYDLGTVALLDDRSALAYVWRDTSLVLAHDWDPDHFARTDLPHWSS